MCQRTSAYDRKVKIVVKLQGKDHVSAMKIHTDFWKEKKKLNPLMRGEKKNIVRCET